MTPESVGIVPRHRQPDVEQRLPCPRCDRGERDKALSLKFDFSGSWVAYCHRCQWSCRARAERGGSPVGPIPAPLPAEARTESLSAPWRRVWQQSRRLHGTIAENYLLDKRRCVMPPEDGDLRFHPAAFHWPSRTHHPALVALATDAERGIPRTLHLTFLAADGSGKAQVQPARLLIPGHSKSGAVIRLWPDEAITHGLGLAEGIESALSLAHAGLPVWAAIDAGNLGALPVLEGIDELTVAVDRDPAGERAADSLAHRWVTAGRKVRLVKPIAGDVNDCATGTYVRD